MKLIRGAVRPQNPLTGAPTGKQFAEYLLTESGIDAVRMRTLIEEACFEDLSIYFKYREIESSRDWLNSLISAELAGGTFAALNLPERLKRNLPSASMELVSELSVDISILLSDKRTDFNYFRYTLNAVSKVMGSLLKENLLDEIPDLSQKEKLFIEKDLRLIQDMKLSNIIELNQWLDKLTNFHYKLIELMSSEPADDESISNRNEAFFDRKQNMKNYVSTKSMSTYRLRVVDYSLLKAQSFIKDNQKFKNKIDFEVRINKYKNYTAPTKNELIEFLDKFPDKNSIEKRYKVDAVSLNFELDNQKIVSIVETLSRQRSLKINFAGELVAKRLIKPIINSLKSQLLIVPNQRIWKSEASSGSDFLSVEIEGLKNEDLLKIQKILELHSK